MMKTETLVLDRTTLAGVANRIAAALAFPCIAICLLASGIAFPGYGHEIPIEVTRADSVVLRFTLPSGGFYRLYTSQQPNANYFAIGPILVGNGQVVTQSFPMEEVCRFYRLAQVDITGMPVIDCGCQWPTAIVLDGQSNRVSAGFCDLQILSNGTRSIAYLATSNGTSFARLYFAIEINRVWLTQAVPGATPEGQVFLSFDAEENPRIVYKDATNRFLYIATKVAGTWTNQRLVVTQGPEYTDYFAVPRNRGALDFFAARDGTILFYRASTGGWMASPVITEQSSPPNWISIAAVKLPTGKYAVAGYRGREMAIFVQEEVGWSRVELPLESDRYLRSELQITVKPSGEIVVAAVLRDGSGQLFELHIYEWSNNTVLDSIVQRGVAVSIDNPVASVHPDGSVVVGFRYANELRVATQNGTHWCKRTVAEPTVTDRDDPVPGRFSSLAVDLLGRVNFAFDDPTTENLKIARSHSVHY